MLIILLAIILFHLAAVILLLVATIYNAWWVVTVGGKQEAIFTDLWYSCNSTCYPVENSHTASAAYLQAVQATMILATILCCISFFVFILQLFKLQQGERFFFTAIIQLLASVCVMIAASIYTEQKDSFHVVSLREGSYGASYILAWISFPMTLISGVLYLVLRKRK